MSSTKLYTAEELLKSPTFTEAKYDSKKFMTLIKKCVHLQKAIVSDLKLPQWVLISASVFMHRFWARRSMEKNLPPLVAAACVFIASKVDESPRNLRDFAYVYIKNKNPKGSEVLQRMGPNADELLKPVMEEFLTAERAIMYTIDFDFKVDQPYRHVVNGLKKLGIQSPNMTTEEAALFQHTVNMTNDSLPTTLSLRYEGFKIAYAAIYIMAAESNFMLPLPEGVSFFELFNISEAEIDDMRPQLMAPYKKKPSTAPTPAKPLSNTSVANTSALPGPQVLMPTIKPNGLPVPKFKVITELSEMTSCKELEEGDTSGERNNNNDSVEQLISRKRTRSPEHDEPLVLRTSPSISTLDAGKSLHLSDDQL
ncbi:hypothetical protein CEUSTIGMA_g5489.t1 [Chlamydomonas eustigma]|uniref:Cyclin N-terminal domain-containing protein n=1 Tax=Chlamydomonas eustigma TaxID=1157962 RepID=A0A250X4N0_9CHLO|nr:hypothetical protein CEUSTIGMA_g5489.t1 [Chlamydomonas eustigma]|eukprot:GAX78047.1 hypothetical protein CEUSTIGMA_g5489.t1 [Chlamydomonas eustigma]